MRILDPYRHCLVEQEDCARGQSAGNYVALRPYGEDRWFAFHVPTGTTAKLESLPVLQHSVLTAQKAERLTRVCEELMNIPRPFDANRDRLRMPDAEAIARLDYPAIVVEQATQYLHEGIDTASLEESRLNPRLKALFVAGTQAAIAELTDVGLTIATPTPLYDSAVSPFRAAKTFSHLALRRDGMLIDATALTKTQIDAAVQRLEGLGYDCLGLFVGGRSLRQDRDALRPLFGPARFLSVSGVAEAKSAARRLLSRPTVNATGRKWIQSARPQHLETGGRVNRHVRGTGARAAPSARLRRKQARTAVYRQQARTAKAQPRPPVFATNESEDDFHQYARRVDPHTVAPGWTLPQGTDWHRVSYGGVLTDSKGRVLLRKPSNNFDGYAWTFSKGKKDDQDEHPADVATREVREETGHTGRITGFVPGAYKGGTGLTYFYKMKSAGFDPSQMDAETEDLRWATPEEAEKLIKQSTNQLGRKRDLAVLQAVTGHVPAPEPERGTAIDHGPAIPVPKSTPNYLQRIVRRVVGALTGNRPSSTPTSVNQNPWAPKPYNRPRGPHIGEDEEDVVEDGGPSSHAAASKLVAHVMRTPHLHQQYLLGVVRPVALYSARKTYDRKRAPLLARHLVVAAGKHYAKVNRLDGEWHQTFNQGTRQKAEVLFRNAAERDARSRRYDSLLPKKWQRHNADGDQG